MDKQFAYPILGWRDDGPKSLLVQVMSVWFNDLMQYVWPIEPQGAILVERVGS